jgi:hypothetical protein
MCRVWVKGRHPVKRSLGRFTMGNVDNWNLFGSDGSDGYIVKDPVIVNERDDSVEVLIKVNGSAARIIKSEAHRRGISYNEMAVIFIEQGTYFWSPKS